MVDVPISNALIDSAQFQVQSVAPATTDVGNVRLFRGTEGWAEKDHDGNVTPVQTKVFVSKRRVLVAEIESLHLVPVVLAADPGVDKVLRILDLSCVCVGGSSFWSGTPEPQIIFGVAPTEVGLASPYPYFQTGVFTFLANDIAVSITSVGHTNFDWGGSLVVVTLNLIHTPLSVWLDNPLTGGNSELSFITTYEVLDVS